MPVAAVVGSVAGGLIASRGAKKAGRAQADAATQASDAAVAEQRRQFDIIRGDTAPYRQVGNQALNALAGMYGYNSAPAQAAPSAGSPAYQPPGMQMANEILRRRGFGTLGFQNGRGEMYAGDELGQGPATGKLSFFGSASPGVQSAGPEKPAAPNYANFFASPDYQFRRDEGMRGIEQSFAARGGAASGNALRALAEFNSNLAGSEFGNYFNRQASLAGIGQTAVGQSGQAGMNAANQIGNSLMNAGAIAGDARASGIVGQANALGGGLANALNAWQYGRGGGQNPWAWPGTPPFNPNAGW